MQQKTLKSLYAINLENERELIQDQETTNNEHVEKFADSGISKDQNMENAKKISSRLYTNIRNFVNFFFFSRRR